MNVSSVAAGVERRRRRIEKTYWVVFSHEEGENKKKEREKA